MAIASVIRPAQPSDIEAVVKLCAEHAQYENAEFCPDGKRKRLGDALFSEHPRLWCFVVEIDGSIVGYATCTVDFSTWRATDFLHMDCLYVGSPHRNAGIGAELMQVIARHAEAMGCTTLEWQTPAWNRNAARFYERLGARSIEKIRFCWTPK